MEPSDANQSCCPAPSISNELIAQIEFSLIAFLISSVISISLFIASLAIANSQLQTTKPEASWLLSIASLVVAGPLALASGHYWSIRILELLCDAVSNEGKFHEFNINGELISAHGCFFCGSSSKAPVICRHCGSIQWGSLLKAGRIGLPFLAEGKLLLLKYNWSMAVFVAEHRWRIVTTYFGIAVPILIVLSVQTGNEAAKRNEAKRITYRANTTSLIDSMNIVRGSLIKLETQCSVEAKADCHNSYDNLMKGYMNFSWAAPTILAELETEAGCELEATTTGSETAQMACKYWKTYLIAMDRAFELYIGFYNSIDVTHSSTGAECSSRLGSAAMLFTLGKAAACIVDVLGYAAAKQLGGLDVTQSAVSDCWHILKKFPTAYSDNLIYFSSMSKNRLEGDGERPACIVLGVKEMAYKVYTSLTHEPPEEIIPPTTPPTL